MGPGDPFAAPRPPQPAEGDGAQRGPGSDRRLALGFVLGALLGLSLWQLGLGATLAALVMGGLGMLAAARGDALARVARLLWERFCYRFLR